MKECFLTSNVIDDKRKLCELACQIGNDNTTCKGTSELSSITKLPIGISLRPGSPCDNYQVDNKRKSQLDFLTVLPLTVVFFLPLGLLWCLSQVPCRGCRRSFGSSEELALQSWNATHHSSMDHGTTRRSSRYFRDLSSSFRFLLHRNTGGLSCWWVWPLSSLWASSSSVARYTPRRLIQRSNPPWVSRKRYDIRIARYGGSGISLLNSNNNSMPTHRLLTLPLLIRLLMANLETSIIDLKVIRFLSFSSYFSCNYKI